MVRLPLRVSGSSVAFSDVDIALGSAVERTLAGILRHTVQADSEIYLLQIELLDARAEQSADRIFVELVTRVTLRRRLGNAYVAQTHAHARSAGTTDPTGGANAVRSCVDSVASQVQGWMSDALHK